MPLHVSCIAMAIGSVGVVMAGLVGVTERALIWVVAKGESEFAEGGSSPA